MDEVRWCAFGIRLRRGLVRMGTGLFAHFLLRKVKALHGDLALWSHS